MNLKTIYFPVYQLPVQPNKEDNIVYINEKVLDNLNLPYDTLGNRRLHIEDTFKLKNALYYLKDMIKLTKGSSWFIDSKGNYFEYRKTKKVPLVFKPITKVIPILSGGALIEVENNFNRFKVIFAPKPQERYAGLLIFSPHVYILYGLYDKQYKDTNRMI